MTPVTLKDLALELGLTTAAVSMALRNHPRISLATRQRAQELARRRGYVPNPAVARYARLRHSASRPQMPLALILQRHPGGGPYHPELQLNLIRTIAAPMGYLARMYVQDETLPPARLNEILYATGTEAVVLGPLFDPSLLEALDWDRFSVVAWEAGCVLPPCHIVLTDIGWHIIEGVRRCRARGYRRVGLVLLREPIPPIDHTDRRSAIAYCERELSDRSCRFFSTEIWLNSPETFMKWFKRFRPDAVIGQNDLIYWWLKDMGLRPGRDCGFLDLFRLYEGADPTISGYTSDRSGSGRVALRLLDSEVRNFEQGKPDLPQRILMRMPWHEGITLPAKTRCANDSENDRAKITTRDGGGGGGITVVRSDARTNTRRQSAR